MRPIPRVYYMGPRQDDDDDDQAMPRTSLKVAVKPAIREDWCVMSRIRWDVQRWNVIRVPERMVPYYARRGWSLLVRDSEFPVPILEPMPIHSAPVRNADPGDERPPDYGEA